MYVCVCNAITDKDIKKAICDGACSVNDLSKALNVGTCCGKCKSCCHQYLKQAKTAPTQLLSHINPAVTQQANIQF